jgi:hypothetical protein
MLTLTDEMSGQIFEFTGLEQPQSLSSGGEQRLAIHEMVGGQRVIDAMGVSLSDIGFGGIFTDGANATDRAGYLQNLMTTGASQILAWDVYRFRGLIRSFHANFESFWRIPYQLTFTPSESLSDPITFIATPDLDSTISSDMASANSYTASIGDPTLTGLMGNLSNVIGGVATFAHANLSLINSILNPIQAAKTQVANLINTFGPGLSSTTGFGGLTTGFSPSGTNLTSQLALSGQVNALYALRNTLGRLAVNVAFASQGSGSTTIAGGNLMKIASNIYGDATAWTGIAKANNMKDPSLIGINTLVIPSSPDTSGGILTS